MRSFLEHTWCAGFSHIYIYVQRYIPERTFRISSRFSPLPGSIRSLFTAPLYRGNFSFLFSPSFSRFIEHPTFAVYTLEFRILCLNLSRSFVNQTMWRQNYWDTFKVYLARRLHDTKIFSVIFFRCFFLVACNFRLCAIISLVFVQFQDSKLWRVLIRWDCRCFLNY